MGEWGSMALAGMAHGCAALPRSPLRPELRPARAASRPGWAGEANPRRASPLCIRVQSPSTLLDGRNGGVWHFRANRELTGCVMARFRAGATAAREEAVASQAVPKPQPARPAASAPPRNQILADLHERRAKRRQVRGVGRCGGV